MTSSGNLKIGDLNVSKLMKGGLVKTQIGTVGFLSSLLRVFLCPIFPLYSLKTALLICGAVVILRTRAAVLHVTGDLEESTVRPKVRHVVGGVCAV